MNKKKQLNQAVMKMINIGATVQSDAEMHKAIQSLSRKDRRILMREGEKRRAKEAKQKEVDHGTEGRNI